MNQCHRIIHLTIHGTIIMTLAVDNDTKHLISNGLPMQLQCACTTYNWWITDYKILCMYELGLSYLLGLLR